MRKFTESKKQSKKRGGSKIRNMEGVGSGNGGGGKGCREKYPRRKKRENTGFDYFIKLLILSLGF